MHFWGEFLGSLDLRERAAHGEAVFTLVYYERLVSDLSVCLAPPFLFLPRNIFNP